MGQERANKDAVPLVIGVDGGGTKTVALLAKVLNRQAVPHPYQVIGQGAAGPSNPSRLGVEPAARAIRQAIGLAFAHAGVPPSPVQRLAAGIAGTGAPQIRQELEDVLINSGLAHEVMVFDDVSPVLHAALAELRDRHIEPAYPVVVLASGTGSMAWGITAAGRTARAGGLGAESGDLGSGYAIGRDALLAHLDLPAVRDFDPSDTRSTADATKVAALARFVIESSDRLPEARAILGRAAQDLADLVGSVLDQLSADPALPITLVTTGSVLCRGHAVKDAVAARLHARGLIAEPSIAIAEPVRGVLLLAVGGIGNA